MRFVRLIIVDTLLNRCRKGDVWPEQHALPHEGLHGVRARNKDTLVVWGMIPRAAARVATERACRNLWSTYRTRSQLPPCCPGRAPRRMICPPSSPSKFQPSEGAHDLTHHVSMMDVIFGPSLLAVRGTFRCLRRIADVTEGRQARSTTSSARCSTPSSRSRACAGSCPSSTR